MLIKQTNFREMQPISLQYWLSMLSGSDFRDRLFAVEYLRRFPEQAGEFLSVAVGHRKKLIRWEAVKFMAMVSEKRYLPLLIKALFDPVDSIRWLAADGIIAFGFVDAAELKKIIASEAMLESDNQQIAYVLEKASAI